MKVHDKLVIVLYLEDWQKRLIKDFLGKECDTWDVPIKEAHNLKYGSPCPPSEHKRMYLTDWQMRELRDLAGVTCDFIELEKGIVLKYFVSPK